MDQQQTASSEPLYEVVWPLGKSTSSRVNLAPALADVNLSGKTVCEFWGWVYRGDQMYPIINEELEKRFHGIKVIDHRSDFQS